MPRGLKLLFIVSVVGGRAGVRHLDLKSVKLKARSDSVVSLRGILLFVPNCNNNV